MDLLLAYVALAVAITTATAPCSADHGVSLGSIR